MPRAEDYYKCADFSASDHVSQSTLIPVRAFFGYWILINCLTTFYLNDDGIMHMLYFFSYWGSIASMLGLIFSIKAIQDKKAWQMPAVFATEMAMGFDLVIMPLFWAVLAPKLFSAKWDTLLHIVTNFHLITTHTLPIIGTCVNIYLTKDFVFLTRDCQSMFLLGLIYIYFNYIGTINEGAPMYPVADWSNFWETVGYYTLLAATETLAYWLFAKWL